MSSSPETRTVDCSLPSSLDGYQDLIQQILDELTKLGWKQDLFGIHMALEETISNAIRHGNKEDPTKHVHVMCRMNPSVFWVQICDEGPGFSRAEVPDCRATENLEVPGGRGLALIQFYMTKIEYNQAGNCVTLEKRRDQGEAISDS